MPETSTPSPDAESAPVSRRYQSINAPDGELVIYDGEDHECWVQSDAHVALGAMQ
jgi:alpha-beta hydrolase superfamily lysophospholipase